MDLPWLAVETVELLKSRGYRLIEIDYSERDTLACNVLVAGRQRLLALEENQKTNQKLRQAGFDVRTFPGSELCVNGGGGPTCLTRPLLRTDVGERSCHVAASATDSVTCSRSSATIGHAWAPYADVGNARAWNAFFQPC